MHFETDRRAAVFFDKDGTLIENVPYNVNPDLMKFTRGAELCLRVCDAAGYLLLIVSNQPGVARGRYAEDDLVPVRERLQEMFAEAGAHLLDFYYCPHHPEGTEPVYAINCLCRKPEPGLIRRAAVDHDIDLGSSWLVGDILDDIEAGRKAGCRTILLNNGNETEWIVTEQRSPEFLVSDLAEAALVIASNGSLSGSHTPHVGELDDK
jgi:D,D-heptose 1,7-bisphosphate phosphatase